MITEAYIKGRCDDGVGKLAIVIVEPEMETGELKIVAQQTWVAREPFPCFGMQITPNQFDMEIMAAIWAVNWCNENGRKAVNIYANTKSVTKWYQRMDFPESRPLGEAYRKKAAGLDIFADYAPKADENMFNQLVNRLAIEAE